MKVHHLSCGTVNARGAKVFAPPLASVPCNCLLIESGTDLILVGTGIGIRDMEDPKRLGHGNVLLHTVRDQEQTAIRQIERMGFSPLDVKHILCTHLDRDHTGGLSDFPHARVHVLKNELEAALEPRSFSERDRYRECHFEHGPTWETHETSIDESWQGMHCIKELPGLPPEIILVPLPGHTRGHCGVAVKTDEGWLLHCGDAYYIKDELMDDGRTPVSVRFFRRIAHVEYSKAMLQIERLRRLLKEGSGDIDLLATHDPTGVYSVE